jgi:hypothetical protein
LKYVLADHNVEGHAIRLWDTFIAEGWQELCPIELVMFADVNLAANISDRQLWRFAQSHHMILLTDNRNMKGKDSLALVIREENTFTSIPVLTIGSLQRIAEKEYRQRCSLRLAEIIVDFDSYLGTGLLFIP